MQSKCKNENGENILGLAQIKTTYFVTHMQVL